MKAKTKKVSTVKRKGATTNPYGSNQYIFDPRQELTWTYYTDPKSETFSNAYRSAVKAGYEESTATHITLFDWFNEKCRRLNMLGKAEKVLDKILEMPQDDPETITNKVRANVFSTVVKAKTDVSKFIATTQGKALGYGTEDPGPKNVNIVAIKIVKPDGEETHEVRIVPPAKE